MVWGCLPIPAVPDQPHDSSPYQPQNQSLPLAADWRKLVFSEIQKELPAAVRSAFRVFDSDDNKFIDPTEFKETLKVRFWGLTDGCG